MCSGEFARGQADGDGFLWRIGAAADDDEDGSSGGGAAAACGFIGHFVSGRAHGLGVGCEAQFHPHSLRPCSFDLCRYSAGERSGKGGGRVESGGEACAFSGMWEGGVPAGMGMMTSRDCVMMCSGGDADGVQVLPESLLLPILFPPCQCLHRSSQGYTVMRTCNPSIDAGQCPLRSLAAVSSANQWFHAMFSDVACKIAELVSKRRSDAAAEVVAALAHLPFRLNDLTPESFSCACAHWRMPSISLAAPPCTLQLNESEPDRVVVFAAVNGVAVSGAVFLPSPPPLSPSTSSIRVANILTPSNGGIIQLPPFPPFDMMQPHSIYSPKGAGASPAPPFSALSAHSLHSPPSATPPLTSCSPCSPCPLFALQRTPFPRASSPNGFHQPWSKRSLIPALVFLSVTTPQVDALSGGMVAAGCRRSSPFFAERAS